MEPFKVMYDLQTSVLRPEGRISRTHLSQMRQWYADAGAVARELASRNITVNAVAPGFIQTEMTETLPENAKAQLLALIPLSRFGTPEEVARAVVFLAAEDSAYITGQVLHVNGGMLMV